MDIKIQAWLADIEQSIDEIFEFIGDKKDFNAYKQHLKTKKAVERNLEIIGEAVSRIVKLNPEFNLQNAKGIIGTRNRIIHSYDNISDEIIWAIVSRELMSLREEVRHLFK